MLNNFKIIYTTATDHWFDRTVNARSHHQQATDKGDEHTVEVDTNVSVSSMKTSGWSGLKTSLHGSKQVTKDG